MSHATIEPMSSNVVHIDPEILGGTPVFKGTRVPVETFFDYIQGGEPMSEFLEDFPTVTPEQVLELLEEVPDLDVTARNEGGFGSTGR